MKNLARIDHCKQPFFVFMFLLLLCGEAHASTGTTAGQQQGFFQNMGAASFTQPANGGGGSSNGAGVHSANDDVGNVNALAVGNKDSKKLAGGTEAITIKNGTSYNYVRPNS